MKTVLETAFTTYTKNKVIGNGGTSQVWEVIDDDGQCFAAKVLNISSTIKREVIKRFKNEIHFCRTMKHKNIIEVIDTGVLLENGNKRPFYIMPEYKHSLRDLIESKINQDKYFKYINQILDGVEAAHLTGTFHRDIKPENILFDPISDNLIIADFGIAAFSEEQLFTIVETKDDSRLANFRYASPEQRSRGKSVNLTTDIYSLGLVFNEMITKELAIGTQYKEIKTIFPDLGYMDTIITKMIASNPIDRYQSIRELKMDLIGREIEYTHLQKLNEEKSKIIDLGEIDPLLYKVPGEIISFDWNDNQLSLKLDTQVNREWIMALQNMGDYTAVWNKGPEAFKFRGDTAYISAEEYEIQNLINYFKQWLPKAKAKYIYTLQEERKAEENRIKQEQKRRIVQEEARLRVLRNIKLK